MSELLEISVEKVLPNPEQPRKYFDQAELEGLAESIREHGVIEPIMLACARSGVWNVTFAVTERMGEEG